MTSGRSSAEGAIAQDPEGVRAAIVLLLIAI